MEERAKADVSGQIVVASADSCVLTHAAYDFFPCQYQLWYRARGGVCWYDPIFKVETIDGRKVWRRRHYRVRRAEIPGAFYFSVLDNGVVSSEFWRIVDVADDLSYAVFAYSGAASRAGVPSTLSLSCRRWSRLMRAEAPTASSATGRSAHKVAVGLQASHIEGC